MKYLILLVMSLITLLVIEIQFSIPVYMKYSNLYFLLLSILSISLIIIDILIIKDICNNR